MKKDLSKYKFEKTNQLKHKRNKQDINMQLNLLKNKTFNIGHNFLFYLANLLIISTLLISALSDISIRIKVYFSSTNYDYKIINVKYIGQPAEIYIDSESIKNMTNFGYKYSDDFLKIRVTDRTGNYYIKLVWRSEISMNSTILPDDIDENDDNKEVVFDTLFTSETPDTIESTEYSDIIFNDNLSPETTLIQEVKEETEKIQEEEYTIILKNSSLNGSHMFANCGSLTIIDFSDFDTTLIYNMSYMFYYCTSLNEIRSLSPVNSQNMSYFLYYCYSLTKIDFIFPQSTNSSQVTNMKYMFYCCASLTSINLTNIYTNNVVNMYGMFYDCYRLQTIIFDENFDVSSVTDMTNMFRYCYQLTSLNLENMNAISALYINNMFYECNSLTYLNLYNFNIPKVKSMSSLFYYCNRLTY